MIGIKKQLIMFLLSQDDNKKFEIKEYREKRGLKANKYYWSLLNELANVLRMDKNLLHFNMLQSYGQSTMIALKNEISPLGYFKYFIDMGSTTIYGVELRKLKVFKPSSEMDSREFSILLEGLIQECKQQCIVTLEDREIKEMIKDYEVNHTK